MSRVRLTLKKLEESIKAAHLPEIQLWLNIRKVRELDFTDVREIYPEPYNRVALIEDSVSVSVYTHNLHLISHGDLRKATCFYLSVETGSRYLNSVKSRFTIQTLFHGINADLTIFVTAG